MTTVQSCGFRHLADINFNDEKSASKWDGLATVCITRAQEALKEPTGTYTKVHRDTMSDLLKAMLVTHGYGMGTRRWSSSNTNDPRNKTTQTDKAALYRSLSPLRSRPNRVLALSVDLPPCRPGPWSKTRRAG